uniref:Reverse transcriptase domain-containing protein n=1 Tax=Cannabis sativa TaxID=3483 RepID=A0A803PWZ9_CANSA
MGANCFDDFRPISLCNFTYKIISKLLANRLRPLLKDLISPFQSAFVPGRWIAENSIMAHEVLDSFKKLKGREGFVGLKLDMSKAYDRIEWGFLERTLQAFGFDARFIGWIMYCVSSVSWSILLNGGPLKQFKPSRGLRQGDPLSPYLFILCSEVLSRMLLAKEAEGLISGFKVSRGSPSISHLMYADDTFVFCKANVEEVNTILDCINEYGAWSGQRLNVQKSAYVFSDNTARDTQLEIVERLGFRKLGSEDKFLGNPIQWTKSKMRDFKFLKDKILAKIEGWRCKLLSQAGRATLIRSVAQSVPMYSMSSFLLPKGLCRELDQAIRKFWWTGGGDKDRYLALVEWDALCLPMDRGGLNFKKFEDINLALLAKLGWKLASGDTSLWCTIFKEKYWGRSGHSFWTALLPGNASFGARGILATRDLIRKESCFIIANGNSVDLWNSPWIPWLEWNSFRAAFNPMIVPTLLKVSSLLNDEGDWDPLLAHRGNNLDVIWNRIWKLNITERLKMFLWKLGRDALPFGSRLQRIFGNPVNCVLCGESVDSWLHLFCHCPLAKATWFGSQWAIRGENLNFSCPRDFILWLLDPGFLGSASTEDREAFSRFEICLCDELWNARNKAYHEQEFPTCLGVLAKVNSACSAMRRAWEEPVRIDAQVSWDSDRDRLNGRRTVYVDAACKDLRATAGIVMKEADGSFSGALTVQLAVSNPLEAETLALYHAVLWCASQNWRQVVFVSDCQSLVRGIHSRAAPNWRLASSFWLLLHAIDLHPQAEFVWLPRTLNQVAHNVCQWAFNFPFSGVLSAEDLAPLVAM